MKKKKTFTISNDEINMLFEKFSHPLTKTALDDTQKHKAISIARFLWLPLVKCQDSEQNIYNWLSQIEGIDNQGNLSIGALYFHKMKEALSATEILKLRNHYKSEENFKKLEKWHDLL